MSVYHTNTLRFSSVIIRHSLKVKNYSMDIFIINAVTICFIMFSSLNLTQLTILSYQQFKLAITSSQKLFFKNNINNINVDDYALFNCHNISFIIY